MARFDEMSAEQLAEITSKGGKAKAEKYKNGNDKTIEDIVKEQVNNNVLRELVKGLIESGKKGNVKAVETILKYMDQKSVEEIKNEFEL